jgi:glycosyltransferase involved in cell wall biosynthesis
MSSHKKHHAVQIAFFPMLPSSNAATRAFCDRPCEHLQARGFRGRVFSPSSPAMFDLLARRGGHKKFYTLRASFYWYALVLPRRIFQLACALRYDAIFIQRSLLRLKSRPTLERALWLVANRLLGKLILYHCDDALYAVAPERHFLLRSQLASCVLTGNEEVATFARRVNTPVIRFEGAVEVDRYPVKQRDREKGAVIGWVGHGAPEVLRAILPTLAEVCEEHDAILKIVSDQAPETTLGGRLVFEKWTLSREFELFGDFDIGIMPLEDTTYNRGKEAFKVKEYMASGLPVVASAVGHNRHVVVHGETGFVARSSDEWISYLSQLLVDRSLRNRLGAAGRAMAEERYSAARQVDQLVRLIRGLGSDAKREPMQEVEGWG